MNNRYSRRSAYRQPSTRRGPDMDIHEKRPDVLSRILAKVKERGTFRQDYSNGEFTASSTIFSLTEAGVQSRSLDLECAADEYHFDPEAKVWWRRSGSFD